MNILHRLIQNTTFAQAEPIWQERREVVVFEPFFACLLVGLFDDENHQFFADFVAQTKKEAEASLATGGYSSVLQSFWQSERQALLLEKLHQSSLVDKSILKNALPLAVHRAFDTLAPTTAHTLKPLILSELDDILPALPDWAEEVLGSEVLAALQVERLLFQTLSDEEVHSSKEGLATKSFDPSLIDPKNPDHPALDDGTIAAQNSSLDSQMVATPKRANHPYWLALPALLLLFLVGAGAYYFSKKQAQTPKQATEVATPKPTIAALPPSTLSITVGENGDLYACHAEVGNRGLSEAIVNVLQTNFASTRCMIDINEKLGQTLLGLEKLTSVLGLLKTAPYASLELHSDTLYINAPNDADVSRLVTDIGAIMSGLTVKKMSALDETSAISQSITRATDALNALPSQAEAKELARAMSLQIIDTRHDTLPDINKAVLALSANFLKNNPNTRLIIAVHSDDMGDKISARNNTQLIAEAIKAELMAGGASDAQLIAQGVGADFPRTDNHTDLGRFKNRRVEFLVYDEHILAALSTPISAPIPNASETLIPESAQEIQVAPMADSIAPSTVAQEAPMPPTLAVQGNQIVEVSPQSSYQAPTYQAPSQPAVSYGAPTQSSPASAGSQIPDDLLTPIGSDPANGQAVQYQDVQ